LFIQNLALMKTRMEKLQILVGLEEGIQSFKDQIQLKKDTITHRKNFNKRYFFVPLSFYDEINECEHNIDIYERCIKRLEQRFNKVRKTLK